MDFCGSQTIIVDNLLITYILGARHIQKINLRKSRALGKIRQNGFSESGESQGKSLMIGELVDQQPRFSRHSHILYIVFDFRRNSDRRSGCSDDIRYTSGMFLTECLQTFTEGDQKLTGHPGSPGIYGIHWKTWISGRDQKNFLLILYSRQSL